MEFLKKIFDTSPFRMERKYNLYTIWKTYVPTIYGCEKRTEIMNGIIKVSKVDSRAVLPKKAHDDDAGFDLTIIEKLKDVGSDTALYRTGLKFQFFEPRYYLGLYARSSLVKSGYIITNSVGIIDPNFLGEVLVCLTKVDPNAKDIECPIKVAQLIPHKIEDFKMKIVELSEFEDTERGTGGFGSTG